MLRWILLATLFAHVQSEEWFLKANTGNVIVNLTADVKLICFSLLSNSVFDYAIVNISLLAIQKKVAAQWENQVFLERPNDKNPVIVRPNDNEEASGYIDPRPQAPDYLSYKWKVASNETLGTFRCQAIGFDSKGNSIEKQSAELTIKEIIPTLDGLIRFLAQFRKDVDKRLLDDEFGLHYWPAGPYLLMTPKTGCPSTMNSDLLPWSIHIKSKSAMDMKNVAPPHFPSDTFTRTDDVNTFNFHSCLSPSYRFGVGSWPIGSYCILGLGENAMCPLGFFNSMIMFHIGSETDLEVQSTSHNIATTYNIDVKEKRVTMFFCCRRSGNHHRPILLPKNKPFYLFRFQGQCQKVLNMQATETYLLINTDPSKEDTNTGEAPDTSNNPLKIHMCYYVKQSEDI